jgi:hypothetical protein
MDDPHSSLLDLPLPPLLPPPLPPPPESAYPVIQEPNIVDVEVGSVDVEVKSEVVGDCVLPLPSNSAIRADHSSQNVIVLQPLLPESAYSEISESTIVDVEVDVQVESEIDVKVGSVDVEVGQLREKVRDFRSRKLERLKNLDLFCLDNSIRESTVGQLRSHTLENKKTIFREVKKCGIKDVLVASFAHMTRVDDDFVQYLVDTGEDFSNFYSFSEVTEGLKDGVYDTEKIPIGLIKNKKYGLRNILFEMDLASTDCDWGGKWTMNDHCQMHLRLFRWVRRKISKDARILVNVRDFGLCMASTPKRLLDFVHFLGSLPSEERIFAFVFEDVLGDSLPEELEMWTTSVRNVMDSCGWNGRLLLHVHQQWDMQTASVLSCLAAGADGVWASLCEEGAVVGHACSSVTIMNLVRLGNKKVLEKYDCHHLRTAARKVTKITTGKDPAPKQVLYGDRAIDMVFGLPLGVARTFDVAKFFGVKPVVRMSTMCSGEMIRDRLVDVFGSYPQFTLEIGDIMKEKMLDDLREGRKEEYMSKAGLLILFERAGGKLSEDMVDAAENEVDKKLLTGIPRL